jgi:hypothetical protein
MFEILLAIWVLQHLAELSRMLWNSRLALDSGPEKLCAEKKAFVDHSLSLASLWTTTMIALRSAATKIATRRRHGGIAMLKMTMSKNLKSEFSFFPNYFLLISVSECRFASATLLPRNHLFSTEPRLPLRFNRLLQKAIEYRVQEGQTFLFCLSLFMKSFQTESGIWWNRKI